MGRALITSERVMICLICMGLKRLQRAKPNIAVAASAIYLTVVVGTVVARQLRKLRLAVAGGWIQGLLLAENGDRILATEAACAMRLRVLVSIDGDGRLNASSISSILQDDQYHLPHPHSHYFGPSSPRKEQWRLPFSRAVSKKKSLTIPNPNPNRIQIP